MDVQQLSDGKERSFLLVLAPGEEVVEGARQIRQQPRSSLGKNSQVLAHYRM
jgi:hypothetical protein